MFHQHTVFVLFANCTWHGLSRMISDNGPDGSDPAPWNRFVAVSRMQTPRPVDSFKQEICLDIKAQIP
jgi:hypothetical protein